ncbi:phosphosulfolactate synthase [Halobacillus litoralis]|uniref:phosphosulfolactate synthase n=1 Tax=Halobacillus litoralis TaxID=45668 RepID=UPI001CD4B46F|nr:phosphosulfolactate synthase [Halobacillus litoralis]MCA0971585.1 phosphosulfolactate synthase [Halobacillus litoralis]
MNNFFSHTESANKRGENILIDKGLPTRYFQDVIESQSSLVDFVKFGWGTSIVSPNIDEKIDILRKHNVKYFFGGTLFEKSVLEKSVEDYINYCLDKGCEFVEISNGTINLSNSEKSHYISEFSKKFKVFSEVGYKDEVRSEVMTTKEWLSFIRQDIEAGAIKVITETRESGQSGICNSSGEIKEDVIEVISEISKDKLIFEAPNKDLQVYFIKKFGCEVNLANVSFDDLISLETLRFGLRSDTLL